MENRDPVGARNQELLGQRERAVLVALIRRSDGGIDNTGVRKRGCVIVAVILNPVEPETETIVAVELDGEPRVEIGQVDIEDVVVGEQARSDQRVERRVRVQVVDPTVVERSLAAGLERRPRVGR